MNKPVHRAFEEGRVVTLRSTGVNIMNRLLTASVFYLVEPCEKESKTLPPHNVPCWPIGKRRIGHEEALQRIESLPDYRKKVDLYEVASAINLEVDTGPCLILATRPLTIGFVAMDDAAFVKVAPDAATDNRAAFAELMLATGLPNGRIRRTTRLYTTKDARVPVHKVIAYPPDFSVLQGALMVREGFETQLDATVLTFIAPIPAEDLLPIAGYVEKLKGRADRVDTIRVSAATRPTVSTIGK